MGQNQSSSVDPSATTGPQNVPDTLVIDGQDIPLEVENDTAPEPAETARQSWIRNKIARASQHQYVVAATSHKYFYMILIAIIILIVIIALGLGLGVGLRDSSSSSSPSSTPTATTQGFPVLTDGFEQADTFGPSLENLDPFEDFQTSANQTEVLKIFQKSVENPPYLQWYGEDPCDGWTGITCTADKKIIGFEYDNAPDIATSIPPQFSELSDLTTLILNNDGITGTIPPQLSVLDMQNFQVLNHKMNGTLPAQLSTWTNLKTFDLSATDSTGSITGTLPPELSQWTNLVSFGMENNFLTGQLPIQYSGWHAASVVQLSNNAFTGSVPEEFLEWGDLSFLSISPQTAGGLCLTRTLSQFLAGTNITVNIFGLPDCITAVEKSALVTFRDSVQDRTLLESWSGPDPCETWTGVKCLNGSVISIEYGPRAGDIDAATSIPPQFSELDSLSSLILNNDGITGTIPPELSVLDIEEFEIGNHKMQGTLPPQLSTWKNIVNFKMDAAPTGNISGPLPVGFSVWKNLNSFSMLDNGLSGFLPVQFSMWKGVSEIGLKSNNLGGTVPEQYSVLQSLDVLLLANQTRDRLCITDSLILQLTQEIGTQDLDEMRLC